MKGTATVCRTSLRCRIREYNRGSFRVVGLLKAAEGAKPSWTQDTDEVVVRLRVPKHVTNKAVELTVHPKRMQLDVDGDAFLSGSLEDAGVVDVDGSYWFMDDSKESEESKCLTVVLMKKTMGHLSFSRLLEEDRFDTTITQRIDGKDAGVLIFGFYGKTAPGAVQYFTYLFQGDDNDDKDLSFEGAAFKHIYPAKFANFGILKTQETVTYDQDVIQNEKKGPKHDRPGLLTIDPDGRIGDFALTFNSVPQFDDKCVVFGRVTHGLDLLARIEAQGDEKTGKPLRPVTIEKCALIEDSDVESIIEEEKKRRIFESD